MRSNWDDADWGGVPNVERTLARLRMHHTNATLPWRLTLTAGVLSARAGDLEPWIRGVTQFFAALPYRLVDEEIGPVPQDPGHTVARLTFERTDIEQLRAELRRGGDG